MGSSAFEISIILLLPLHRKDIYGLECRKLRERNYSVFTALSGILKNSRNSP